MITFTDEARERVLAFMEMEDGELVVKIEVLDSSPLAPRYDLALIEASERGEADETLDAGGFGLVVDPDLKTDTAQLLHPVSGERLNRFQPS